MAVFVENCEEDGGPEDELETTSSRAPAIEDLRWRESMLKRKLDITN